MKLQQELRNPTRKHKTMLVYSVLVSTRINLHFSYRLCLHTNSIRRGSPTDIRRITFIKSISFMTFTGKTAGA